MSRKLSEAIIATLIKITAPGGANADSGSCNVME